MDLSKAALDVPTTRALVKCLNSNGSIAEYEALINKTSDEQLKNLLEVTNKEIIDNPSRLRLIDQSFEQMNQRGILDRAFDKVSKILAKGKFIRAAVNLARQGTHTGAGGELDRSVLQSLRIGAEEITDHKTGAEGLAAARANLDRMLGTGVAMTSLKSYRGMVDGLRSTIAPLPGNSLDFLIRKGHEYAKAKIDTTDQIYAKIMLWGIADGTLFKAFDHYYNEQCDEGVVCTGPRLSEDHQIAAMEAFMRLLTLESTEVDGSFVSNRDVLLKPMSTLFHVMNAQIDCMAGTKKIPNGDLFVMSELAGLTPIDVPQWLMRTNIMKIKLANSMCKFPGYSEGETTQTFNQLVKVLREMARYETKNSEGQTVGFGRPMITVSHFINALEKGEKYPLSVEAREDLARYLNYPENERYRRFLINWMGDVGAKNIYTHLADSLAELSRVERSVLGNALYFLNVPAVTPPSGVKPPVAREDFIKLTRILMKVRPDLATADAVPGSNPRAGRSMYDVALNALLKVDTATVVEVARGLSEFIDMTDDFANPLLNVTRDALLVNDVDPLLEVALNVAREAESRKVFFQTLFDIADTKEFEDAMRLTAKMAQNGSLKELIQGVLTMFKGTTNLAPGNATPGEVPAVPLVGVGRDKSTFNRPSWNPLPAKWPKNSDGVQACYAIDLDLKFGDAVGSGAVHWHDQMEKIAACVDANDENRELADFIRYGNNAPVSKGRSMLAMLVDMVKDLIPGDDDPNLRDIFDELTDLMVNESTFRDMKAMNDLLPMVVGKKFCSTFQEDPAERDPWGMTCADPAKNVAVAQALGRVSGILKNKPDEIQQLLNVGKVAATHPQGPRAGLWLWDKYWQSEELPTDIKADEKPPLESYPLSNYVTGGSNKILKNLLIQNIEYYEKRKATPEVLREKYEEYWGQVNTHENKCVRQHDGRMKCGYLNVEDFKAHIKTFLDELSVGNRLEWELAYFFAFDNNPYSTEWWAQWFQRLANQVRPIAYYYPGQFPGKDKPTVRLVSQLDLLEMIVIESDFSLREVGMAGFLGLPGSLFSDPDTNFSIKYLTMLAKSGRDLKPAINAMEKELETFSGLAATPIIGNTVIPEVKRRLFNMRQTFQILRDVDTEHEYVINGKKVMLNDLGVLRDLFKATLSATPVGDRDNFTREKNSLAFICELVKTGLLRNAGINIWHKASQPTHRPLHAEDRDMSHREIVPNEVGPILRFMVESTVVREGGQRKLNRGARDVLHYLLRDDCDKSLPRYRNGCVVPRSEWGKERFNERYVFVGKMLDEFFRWINDDDNRAARGETRVMTYIKRAGYSLSNLVDKINTRPDGSYDQITPAYVPLILKPILGTKKGTDIIAKNFDLLEMVIKDPMTVNLLGLLLKGEREESINFNALREMSPPMIRKLAENDGRSAEAGLDLAAMVRPTEDWKALRASVQWLRRDRDYLDLKERSLNRIFDQVKGWALRDNTKLRPRLQAHTGLHLENGNIRDLLLFIGRESSGRSDRFYKEIEFIGQFDPQTQRYPYVDKLNDFMDLLQRGIKDNYPMTLKFAPWSSTRFTPAR